MAVSTSVVDQLVSVGPRGPGGPVLSCLLLGVDQKERWRAESESVGAEYLKRNKVPENETKYLELYLKLIFVYFSLYPVIFTLYQSCVS